MDAREEGSVVWARFGREHPRTEPLFVSTQNIPYLSVHVTFETASTVLGTNGKKQS